MRARGQVGTLFTRIAPAMGSLTGGPSVSIRMRDLAQLGTPLPRILPPEKLHLRSEQVPACRPTHYFAHPSC